MLEFGKFNGKWDVKIDGLGQQHLVSEVEKTVLKESKVAKNIPTVAEVTQGGAVRRPKSPNSFSFNIYLKGNELLFLFLSVISYKGFCCFGLLAQEFDTERPLDAKVELRQMAPKSTIFASRIEAAEAAAIEAATAHC